MLGEDRSRACVTRARSVMIPFLTMHLTMLFMLTCPDLNGGWLGLEGAGQCSIMVEMRPASACTLVCFSEHSVMDRDRVSAFFTSVTRLVWASGAWLQLARAATSIFTRVAHSLSVEEVSNSSRMKARAVVSSFTSSLSPAGYVCS